MQRSLHLPKQSQESLRRSATGTDNREMGATCLPPAPCRDRIGKSIPLLPAEARCLTATRGDARSPQVCPASLNYARAKRLGSRGPGEEQAGSPCRCPLPQADFPLPSPCHMGWQDAASAVTGSRLSGWKRTSGRENPCPPSKGETTARCHQVPKWLRFAEPPPQPRESLVASWAHSSLRQQTLLQG